VLNGILLCEASRLVPATSEVNHGKQPHAE
jgi:hypothetical protein